VKGPFLKRAACFAISPWARAVFREEGACGCPERLLSPGMPPSARSFSPATGRCFLGFRLFERAACRVSCERRLVSTSLTKHDN
jgi:hypothetical protein